MLFDGLLQTKLGKDAELSGELISVPLLLRTSIEFTYILLI